MTSILRVLSLIPQTCIPITRLSSYKFNGNHNASLNPEHIKRASRLKYSDMNGSPIGLALTRLSTGFCETSTAYNSCKYDERVKCSETRLIPSTLDSLIQSRVITSHRTRGEVAWNWRSRVFTVGLVASEVALQGSVRNYNMPLLPYCTSHTAVRKKKAKTNQ